MMVKGEVGGGIAHEGCCWWWCCFWQCGCEACEVKVKEMRGCRGSAAVSAVEGILTVSIIPAAGPACSSGDLLGISISSMAALWSSVREFRRTLENFRVWIACSSINASSRFFVVLGVFLFLQVLGVRRRRVPYESRYRSYACGVMVLQKRHAVDVGFSLS